MTEEQVVQKLPRRCPYCDGVLEKDPAMDGKKSEEICPHCGRIIVRLSWEEAVRLGERATSGKKREGA